MSDEGKITEIAQAVEGIVKAVPVYQDLAQPAAQEIGKGLGTVAKTIHIALAPISALVWGYEQIKSFVETTVAHKLNKTAPDKIQTPNPLVAGPLLESLRYAGHEEVLRDLYANLLATSIDADTANNAHPGFVHILQNMSPDEAKIMRLFAVKNDAPLIDVKANFTSGGFKILVRHFSSIGTEANCSHQDLIPNYLDNLIRLGLLEIQQGWYIMGEGIYEPLQDSPELEPIKKGIEESANVSLGFDKKKIELTSLGRQFCKACVIDKNIEG